MEVHRRASRDAINDWELALTMEASDAPSATLSHLHRADGSATFSHNGYTVVGAVNGPLEVTRRDELPEEAALDVVVRPAGGSGGTRERHLELILQSTLRQIILIQDFPRTLIQITLQVTGTPDTDSRSKTGQDGSILSILPALLQTSILALLSASMPLAMTMTAVALAVKYEGYIRHIIQNPSLTEVQNADSLHILAFSSKGDLLVAESEGSFTMDEWDELYEDARKCCYGLLKASKDGGVQLAMDDEPRPMMSFLQATLRDKVSTDLQWKLHSG